VSFVCSYSYGFITFENQEDAERIMRKEVSLVDCSLLCDGAEVVEWHTILHCMGSINVYGLQSFFVAIVMNINFYFAILSIKKAALDLMKMFCCFFLILSNSNH